jgi:hypothetical protein
VWVSRHLLEIRASLRSERPRTGPDDVEAALYPLERLLAPLQFPRGAAALAELRVALDADPRAAPAIATAPRIARSVRVHLGLDVDPGGLVPRLQRLEAGLYEQAQRAAASADGTKADALAAARQLLFVEGPCPPVPESRVRSWSPPPERAAICGLVGVITERPVAAAIVALHDDVALALAAVTEAPPPRTRLLCAPSGDVVDGLERSARERPVVALGVALAVERLVAGGSAGESDVDARARAWQRLGEAPLDVVDRELKTPAAGPL